MPKFATCKKVITNYRSPPLIRWVASLERDNFLLFYYLSASENWPDNRGGLW